MEQEAVQAIAAAADTSELEQIRHRYLGRKGALTLLLKTLGGLGPQERRDAGQAANQVKERIVQSLQEREQEMLAKQSVIEGEMDLSLPGIQPDIGGLHPITQM